MRIVENVTDKRPYSCFVDRGYQGHIAARYDLYIAGQKRGVTPGIKKKAQAAQSDTTNHRTCDTRVATWVLTAQKESSVTGLAQCLLA
ncbi:hypothetical protein [Pseudoalteromonas sp. JC28]|uniref:hypothetical protein n=1 Tax=Pseudoalteromonas sp. JC28 TaxID=2267617 RepID=UPI001572732C|nr:hypothetical protein [Pseudoalteromonas sp. JC28]